LHAHDSVHRDELYHDDRTDAALGDVDPDTLECIHDFPEARDGYKLVVWSQNEMRTILAILAMAATVNAQTVMYWDGETAPKGPMQLPAHSVTAPDGSTISTLKGSDWPTCNKYGYYAYVPAVAEPGTVIAATAIPAEPVDGKFVQIATATITIEEQAAQQAAVEADRQNTPIVYDQPIETSALVLQSHEVGTGVGVIADDTGSITTFTYHASPVPTPAEVKARKDEAVARNAARRVVRESVKVKAEKVKGASAAANSVPQLREQVAALAEQVRLLTEAMEP
jgi:hypothetical protein